MCVLLSGLKDGHMLHVFQGTYSPWVILPLFEGTLFLAVLKEHQKEHHAKPFCAGPPPP